MPRIRLLRNRALLGSLLVTMAWLPQIHADVFSSGVILPKNAEAQQLFGAAEDRIREALASTDVDVQSESWWQAARALQSLLELPEDAFVELRRPGPEGKDTVRQVSIRAEASRLIGTMTPDGLAIYELRFGPKARERLSTARAKGDLQMIVEVVQRFPYTKAGDEALLVLGTYYLDRGRYQMAAPCFERLLRREKSDDLPPRTLFKAALAFQRAGNQLQGERIWNKLLPRVQRDGGLQIGDQQLNVDQLKKLLEPQPASAARLDGSTWPLFRGNVSRSALGTGILTNWQARWSVSTLPEKDGKSWIEESLKTATDASTQQQTPVLPAYFPLLTQFQIKVDGPPVDLVVYRGYNGLYGVKRETGQLVWKSSWLDHDLDSYCRSSPNDKKIELDNWRSKYQYPHLVTPFENSVMGTLSTDQVRVFVIDDLPLPPNPQSMPVPTVRGGINTSQSTGSFRDYHERNTLKAYDVATGKIKWELGSPHGPQSLKESYFSGPPLPLDGKLYLLNERKNELRLVCLSCSRDEIGNDQAEVVWLQPLARAADPLLNDANRRLHTAALAYGEGVLTCPTNAGSIIAVDLLSRSLLWAHSYREVNPDEMMKVEPVNAVRNGRYRVNPLYVNTRWKVSPPIIQDSKVIFSAPDSAAVHCLNLRDGRLLWREKHQPDDLYLAGVFNNKVVIVGKNACRAVDLHTGKGLWQIVNLGLPSGQGAVSGNVYYLPLRVGAESNGPEVCVLDIDKGVRLNRISVPKDDVPGNLIFFQGDVISQGLSGLTVYPQANR